MTEIAYQKMIIAFIDVLGFSNFILSKPNSDEIADKLFGIFSAAKDFMRTEGIIEAELKFLSDSFILIFPITPPHQYGGRGPLPIVEPILQYCKTIQCGMLTEGFLTRGCITTGNLFAKDDIIFGEALIDAYRIESRVANVPRIVVHRSMRESGLISSKNELEWRGLIVRDEDGLEFVDYLGWIWEDAGLYARNDGQSVRPTMLSSEESDEADRRNMIDDLNYFEAIRPFIETRLKMARGNRAVFEKVSWLARYYVSNMDRLHSGRRAREFNFETPNLDRIKALLSHLNTKIELSNR